MIAAIATLKKAEFISRDNKYGIEKVKYALKGELHHIMWSVGETLLDLTIDQLKHEGVIEVSAEYADFDIDGETIIVSVATTEEGRKEMLARLEVC